MNQIVFRESHWRLLEHYMTQRTDVESGAYAVFKTSRIDKSQKLLVTEILIPEAKDYLKRTSVRVAFTPEFTEKAFRKCELNRGHLLDIHNHPWSNEVNFSPIDDHEAEHTKIPYVNKYVPDIMIAFLVFGESMVTAKSRSWDKPRSRMSDVCKIVVV